MKGLIRKHLPTLLLTLFLVLIMNLFIWQIGVVASPSMAPTVDEKALIVGNRLSYLNDDPQRGDVVIFTKDNRLLVKRVIGIPGDHIFFKGGQVYLNGELLEEPYLMEQYSTYSTRYEFYMTADKYFLMGDNRKVSDDSRRWDMPTIWRGDISSKVVLFF